MFKPVFKGPKPFAIAYLGIILLLPALTKANDDMSKGSADYGSVTDTGGSHTSSPIPLDALERIIRFIPVSNANDATDYVNFFDHSYAQHMYSSSSHSISTSARIRYTQALEMINNPRLSEFITSHRLRNLYGTPRVNTTPTAIAGLVPGRFYLAHFPDNMPVAMSRNIPVWSIMLVIEPEPARRQLAQTKLRSNTPLFGGLQANISWQPVAVLSSNSGRYRYSRSQSRFSLLSASRMDNGLNHSYISALRPDYDVPEPEHFSDITGSGCGFYAIEGLSEMITKHYKRHYAIRPPRRRSRTQIPDNLDLFYAYVTDFLSPNCRGYFPGPEDGPNHDPSNGDGSFGGDGPLSVL